MGPEDELSIRQRLISAMINQFGEDTRRIDHALTVLKYAEEIQAHEGGSSLVVRAAAILHDIGIHEAQRKHGSTAGKFQEIEGPPIATRILKEIGLNQETIKHVRQIIANHHSARDIDTTEFRIIWDADWLVNFPENFPDAEQQHKSDRIDKIFRTDAGRKKACELFCWYKM